MIVNGVTLPDIPAEVLAQYPYVVIVSQDYLEATGPIGYLMFATKSEILYASAEAFGGANATINTLSTGYEVYSCFSDGTSYPDEWTRMDDQCSETDMFSNPIGEYVINANATVEYAIVWANHDIKEVTGFDPETGGFLFGETYFPNSEAPKPTRVSIGRSLVDGYAREVQRLTGTTEQMNAVQIREKLSTVKAAIKIGNTVLPPIPEDVLAEYPNAVIYKETTTDNSIRYALCVSATPMLLLPKAIAQQVAGKNIDIMYNSYAYRAFYENEAWGDLTAFNNGYVEYEGQMGVAVGEFNGYLYEFIYTNHDIYEVTSVDTSTGQYVLGDIYFSERQNFNGVWLPKIPADVLAEYPYAAVSSFYNAQYPKYTHYLAVSTLSFGRIEGSIIGEPVDEMLASFGEGYGFWLRSDQQGNWIKYSHTPVGKTGLYIGEVPEGAGGQMGTYNLLWTNHDIHEYVDVNLSTGAYTTGDLYYPPLPTIDTDRVSIGYDLCNGIVEEVQRLSGSTEKMNALQAYWKLTTVIGTTAPSGGIVIDGVTLPEIPADVLASYPYCSILGMNGQYMLIGTQSKQVVGLGSGSGNGSYENDYIRPTEPSGYVMYGYGGEFTAWTLQNQSESFGALELMTPIPFVWANHDLYTWVYSTSENEWVMDEIYFPSSI